MASLSATPQVSLADQAVRIRLTRDSTEEPSEIFNRLKLKLRVTNNAGIDFESVTEYKPNVDIKDTAGLATNSIFFCFLFVKNH